MTDFKNGKSGRLATNRYDFEKHIEGTDFRHKADQVDLNPSLTFGSAGTATNVQNALNGIHTNLQTLLTSGEGFITIGDGYDCYIGPSSAPYNSSVPALDNELDSVLNNTSDLRNARLKNGGILLIKSGTYKLTSTINIPSGITIMGEGVGTRLINQLSSVSPMMRIKKDTSRIIDSGTGTASLFMFAKETIFYNLLIADNFVEPKFLGDTSYKVPKNISGETPLIMAETGTSVTFDNVRFVGKTVYSLGLLSSLTTMPISFDGSATTATGSILTIRNSFIDGFSLAAKFQTSNSTVVSAPNDYLYFTNNKVRVYGFLNGDNNINHLQNNCMIKINSCNGLIADNYLYGADTGFINAIAHIITATSGLTSQQYPRFSIVNNIGVLTKTTGPANPNPTINDLGQMVIVTRPNNFHSIADNWWTSSNNDISLRPFGSLDISPQTDFTVNVTGGSVDVETDNNITLNAGSVLTLQSQGMTSPAELSSGVGANGDVDILIAEKSPDGPNKTTIIRRLNSQVEVTVGDGTTSFGDFNGTNSIQKAVAYLSAQSVVEAVIKIKSGNYVVDSGNGNIQITNNQRFSFEGTHASHCIITVNDEDEWLSINGGFSLPGCFIKLNNLSIIATDDESTIAAGNSSLVIENCIFLNSFITKYLVNYTGDDNYPNTLIVKNSTFTGTFNSSSHPITINSKATTASTTIKNIFVENCIFDYTSSDGAGIILFSMVSGNTKQYTISNIYFKNCDFILGQTSSASGNLGSNTGIIQTSTGGNSLVSSTPPLVLNDVHFINCNATAFASDVRVLIHLTPQDLGVNTYTNGVTSYVLINNFEIDGGRWLVPNGTSTTYNPFSIALNNQVAGTKLTVKNILAGFSNSTGNSGHGGETTDNQPWFGSTGTQQWGFMTLTADILEIKNVRMQNLDQRGTAGDFYLLSSNFDVDGIYVSNYILNTLGVSNTQPKRRASVVGSGIVKKIHMTGKSGATSDWVTSTSANNNFGILLVQSNTAFLSIEDCVIQDFYDGSSFASGRVGIRISNATSSIDNLHIINCHVKNSTKESCIDLIKNGSIAVTSLKISGCDVTGTDTEVDQLGRGISISGIDNFEIIDISNNRVKYTHDAGIFFGSPGWNSGNGRLNLCNNNVIDGGLDQGQTNGTGPSIWITDTSAHNPMIINGTVIGNICSGVVSGGNNGIFLENYLPAGTFKDASTMAIRGLEVSFRAETAGSGITFRGYIDSTLMLFNSGYLFLDIGL